MYPRRKRLIFKKYILIYLVIILVLGAFAAGLYTGRRGERVERESFFNLGSLIKKPTDISFDLFWDVWNELKDKYIDESKMSEQNMYYGAISGLVQSLEDPYTAFMNPEEYKKFEEDMEGTFEGIGAEIGIKHGKLTVVAPLNGSPAEKAGLMAQDIILKIDDIESLYLTLPEAVSLIRGPKGSQVKLTVSREGLAQTKEITITRDVIKVENITWGMRENNICYIKIGQFEENTQDQLQQIIDKVLAQGANKIILDLRNNPGGYLNEAVKVASNFLGPDKVVVVQKGRDDGSKEFRSEGEGKLRDFSTVVLVNGGSASASEIVAGALQDYKKAIIIGEKTFGKGSVQNLETFRQGAALKITVAKWYTPNDRCINEKGLEVDVKIKLTEEDINQDRDPQLDKAIEILKEK